MPQEKELTTVAPEVRTKINELSKEVQSVPRETTEAKPEAKPEQNTETQTVQETQQAQAEVQKEIDELQEEVDTTADPKRKSRANERIRELVAEKNRMQEIINNFSRYAPLIEEYERIQQEQAKPKYTEYQTQEEFYNAVKEQAKKEALDEIRKELRPVVEDNTNSKYQKQLNSWFEKNPEAAKVKDDLDKFSQGFSEEEKVFYQKQILNGNTRVLDMIYKAIKPEPSKSDALQKAIKADQQKAGTASPSRASKAVEENSSFDTDLNYAFKKGDWKNLITKHLLT